MCDVQCVFNNDISVTYCGVGTGEGGSRPVQLHEFGVRLTHLRSISQGIGKSSTGLSGWG